MAEMLDPAIDFATSVAFSESSSERLKRWFGLSTFVLLMPETSEVLDDTDMARLQGALNVALTNSRCAAPAFVLHDTTSGDIYGRAVSVSSDGQALGCRFDCKRLKAANVPPALLAPRGMADLLLSKIASIDATVAGSTSGGTRTHAPPSLSVTRRHSYVLTQWPEWAPPLVGPRALQLALGDSTRDPLPSLVLAAQWPPAERASSSQWSPDGYTDSPYAAPVWQLRALAAELDDDVPHSVLPFGIRRSGRMEAGSLSARVGALLSGLATCDAACESSPSGGTAIGPTEASTNALEALLVALAADGCALLDESSLNTCLQGRVLAPLSPTDTDPHNTPLVRCTHGPLLHRMALAALRMCAGVLGDAKRVHCGCALLQLWRGVLGEVRHCWEESRPIAHTSAAAPTPDDSPIAQGVRLVAYSMAVKAARVHEREWDARRAAWRASKAADEAQVAAEAVEVAAATAAESDAKSNTDAALASQLARQAVAQAQAAAVEATAPTTAAAPAVGDDDDHGRVGARSMLFGLVGLRSGMALWAPHTQPEGPLGDLSEAARASRLKSLMMAFKAANPGCDYEDFVRWHAPDEWLSDEPATVGGEDSSQICGGGGVAAGGGGSSDAGGSASSSMPAGEDVEDEVMAALGTMLEQVALIQAVEDEGERNSQYDALASMLAAAVPPRPSASAPVAEAPPPPREVRGRLSARLDDPTSLWHVLWGATHPLAAESQRPLFDADREASEALDRLERLPPSTLVRQLPLLISEAVLGVLATSEMVGYAPRAPEMLRALEASCRELHARNAPPSEWHVALVDGLAEIEADLLRAASLAAKLPHHRDLVRTLLSDPSLTTEADVPEAARPILERMLARAAAAEAATNGDPEPAASEYVFRATHPRPDVEGAVPVAHRMYTMYNGDHWRLAIALSEDLEAPAAMW